MKNYLPKLSLISLKTLQLPKIYRFITEKVVTSEVFSTIKVIVLASLTGVLVLGIIYQGYMLYSNIERVNTSYAMRGELLREVSYWKQLVVQYPGYRDAYFRIASLEYALGDTHEARTFVEKTLQLDPNFEAAYVLGAKVGIFR